MSDPSNEPGGGWHDYSSDHEIHRQATEGRSSDDDANPPTSLLGGIAMMVGWIVILSVIFNVSS